MKILILISLIGASLFVTGCKRDRKCGNDRPPKPPAETTEKVPEGGNTLIMMSAAYLFCLGGSYIANKIIVNRG